MCTCVFLFIWGRWGGGASWMIRFCFFAMWISRADKASCTAISVWPWLQFSSENSLLWRLQLDHFTAHQTYPEEPLKTHCKHAQILFYCYWRKRRWEHYQWLTDIIDFLNDLLWSVWLINGGFLCSIFVLYKSDFCGWLWDVRCGPDWQGWGSGQWTFHWWEWLYWTVWLKIKLCRRSDPVWVF